MPYIEYCDTPYKALKGADAMILVTEWPEFTSLDYRGIKKQMKMSGRMEKIDKTLERLADALIKNADKN